jgi:hypothetical protein
MNELWRGKPVVIDIKDLALLSHVKGFKDRGGGRSQSDARTKKEPPKGPLSQLQKAVA